MNLNELNIIKNNRDTILLAEIGALFHDIGKTRASFIAAFAKSVPTVNDAHNLITKFGHQDMIDFLEKHKIKIDLDEVSLLEIVEKHHEKQANDQDLQKNQVPKIIRLLYAAWNGYDGIESGSDKGQLENNTIVGQNDDKTCIATAFGFEPELFDSNHFQLKENELIQAILDEINDFQDIHRLRKIMIKIFKEFYKLFLGETRRPANDVTLWDHSYSVATMFKCAIASILISNSNRSYNALKFPWNIVSINVDTLAIMSKGIKIGDIFKYRQIIGENLQACKNLIEDEYPIGNEIYRDSTGIYFMIADLNPTQLEEIKSHLRQILYPELMINYFWKNSDLITPPNICDFQQEMENILDNNNYFSNYQQISKNAKKKIKKKITENHSFDSFIAIPYDEINIFIDNIQKISDHVQEMLKDVLFEISNTHWEDYQKKQYLELMTNCRKNGLQSVNFPTSSERFQKIDYTWKEREICPVCQLKPKEQKDEICPECKKQRIKNAKGWIDNNITKNSIWIDEIADQHNQVATIIGKFDLSNWLNGKYINSLVVNRAQINNPPNLFVKNPSLARIRRCWETTNDFVNNTIITNILNNFDYTDDNSSSGDNYRTQRIEFKISPKMNLEEGTAVDIEIEGKIISPVCIDKENGKFLTTHNLNLTVNWGKSEKELQEFLINKKIKVKSEDGKSWKTQDFSLSNVQFSKSKFGIYLPYLPIFTFPDKFMILVPGNQAMDVCEKILKEYQKQFGKVRDRLPLHLGIIGFHRKTPLNLVMETTKIWIDVIEQKAEKYLEAQVMSKTPKYVNDLTSEVKLCLECNDYSSEHFSWIYFIKMGDPSVPDVWYPYIRVKGLKSSDRDLSYAFSNQFYYCHVKDIKKDDVILFDPSYFTLYYLDRASDRWKMDRNLFSQNDFHRIQKLWNNISKKLIWKEWSIKQINAYWQEIQRPFIIQSDNQEIIDNYIKTSIKNILNLTETSETDKDLFNCIYDSTKDGLLEVCLFWNLKIGKFKP